MFNNSHLNFFFLLRHFCFFISVVDLSFAGLSQSNEPNKINGLYGTVMSITETEYFAKKKGENVVPKRMTRRFTVSYNEFGHKLNHTVWNHLMDPQKNDFLSIDKYIYKKDSILIRHDHFIRTGSYSIPESKLQYSIHLEYNAQNNLISKSILYEDDFASTGNEITHFVYDEFNRMIELTTINKQEKVLYSLKIIYNENGEPIRKDYFSYEYDVYFLYEYPSKNQIVSHNFESNGHKISQSERLYDSEGRIVEEKELNLTDGSIINTTTSYDGKGRVVKKNKTDGQKNIIEEESFEYDDFDNETKYTKVGTNGVVIFSNTHSYEYDSHNNWIKKTTSVSEQRYEITTREITYSK